MMSEGDPSATLTRLGALTDRGMAGVQEMLRALRDADREVRALIERVRRLEELACCDPLTALPNQRGLREQLRREEARAQRYGITTSVAMLAVQEHAALMADHTPELADLALVTVANALQACARGTDLVARYSGAIFAALLPGTDGDGARIFTDRVRLALRSTTRAAATLPPLTLATGIATRDDAGTLAAALELAHQRLIFNEGGE